MGLTPTLHSLGRQVASHFGCPFCRSVLVEGKGGGVFCLVRTELRDGFLFYYAEMEYLARVRLS